MVAQHKRCTGRQTRFSRLPHSELRRRYAAGATRRSSTDGEFGGALDPQASVLDAVHRSLVAACRVPHPARNDADVRTDGPVVHAVHDTDLDARSLVRVPCYCAGCAGWCPSQVTGMGPDCVALHRVDRLGRMLVSGAPAAGCGITQHCTGPARQNGPRTSQTGRRRAGP
jgi:hypothetical protein